MIIYLQPMKDITFDLFIVMTIPSYIFVASNFFLVIRLVLILEASGCLLFAKSP